MQITLFDWKNTVLVHDEVQMRYTIVNFCGHITITQNVFISGMNCEAY